MSLCETIRRGDSDIGIIIVSAKGQESDKIRGLSIGADDYITKPFSVSELIARLEALTRRIHRGSGTAARLPRSRSSWSAARLCWTKRAAFCTSPASPST